MNDSNDGIFRCRNPIGATLRDSLALSLTTGGQVVILASREEGSTVISVHLTPEDVLRFAAEALRLADICAKSPVD